jgi:hypothetical protein
MTDFYLPWEVVNVRRFPGQAAASTVPAARSGGPGVLLQQLLGSADLQLVVRSRVIHPHPEPQAVDRFNQAAMLRASPLR